MNSKTIMIHQPDFFPWLGFFDKFSKVDEFVLLDHSISHPSARNWLRRVNILVNNKAHLISLPLKRNKNKPFMEIRELQIQIDDKQFKNIYKTIELNYRKTPYFNQVFFLIEEYFNSNTESLLEKNINFILNTCKYVDINVPSITYSSTLNISNTSSDMIIEVCKKVNATGFLLTQGASEYSDISIYKNNNIEIKQHKYIPQQYSQQNGKIFFPGLSIIDALMNIGFDGVKELLNNKL